VLTVEGTYTSGDREGITVSHEIDFGTMQIKRNYLYKVRIALEDPAGDTYGKVTHAINVKDWTSGVTLAWAGDENLYNNSAAPNFTVTEAVGEFTLDGVKYYTALPFNVDKSATFYVASTSTKSGLNLTCPATSVSATADELALNTSADTYQCKIVPLPDEYVYNQDGTFIQKWKVTVRESALLNGNTLTFSLQNALNSSLSATFKVRGSVYADNLEYGDVIYDNCAVTHKNEPLLTTANAIGVVVYKSDAATSVCEAGKTDSRQVGAIAVTGKVLVMALQDCGPCQWYTVMSHTPEDEDLFPATSANLSLGSADYRGYEKTEYLLTGTCESNSHVHSAASAAWNYHSNFLSSYSAAYLTGSTGWFLGSLGQWISISQSLGANGNITGGNTTATYAANGGSWSGDPKVAQNLESIVTHAGGDISKLVTNPGYYWTSTKWDHEGGDIQNFQFNKGNSYGFRYYFGGSPNDATSSCYVRPLIAY